MTLEKHDPVEQVVRLLSRPIEFASRTVSKRPSSLKGLGPYVTQQVLLALSQRVFSPRQETDLLALRQLFSDYDDGLPSQERARRLAEARRILARLGADQGKGLEVKGKGLGVRGEGKQERSEPQSGVPRTQDLWSIPIRFAKGVGPRRALLLERCGVRTVEDAFWYLPWRYEDRSVVTPISGVRIGSRATVCGVVVGATLKRTARRGMTLLEVVIGDTSGSLRCVYFNQPYLEAVFEAGSRVMISGMVSPGRRGWADPHMDAPQYEILGDETEATLHVGRIVPIYHETKGLNSRVIRSMIKGLLQEYVGEIEQLVPLRILTRLALPGLAEAVAQVHFPPQQASLEALQRGSTKSHQRLAFEEFFLLETALGLRQRSVREEVKGIRFNVRTPLRSKLERLLPFMLTSAQQRVLSEILEDMGASRPMNRLVQGDVGCGKTVVALHAIAVAGASGYQAAVMVPTEILAEQHFLNMRKVLETLGLKVVLLTSGGVARQRKATAQAMERGEADVVVGTHALIQKGMRFRRLGLAVIDEQHKFGVLQRKTLVEKGYQPDVLVLTATPIPRTLAMTVYGDLDCSVIDMLPPGRKPVRTLLFGGSRRRTAYQLVRDQLDAGKQAYVVYPLVQESEKVDLQAALQGAQRLQSEEFRSFAVGVLHGRMKTSEKERAMAAFKRGDTHVLVTTTVVEVGVDVPNATVMVVEHADRFGLAQLHQLRGRVGRGTDQSCCLLLSSGKDRLAARSSRKEGFLDRDPGHAPVTPSRQRLEALVKSSDGFVIAEEDLRIRGPGEFFGVRQWGLPEFRAANLIRDGALLEQARREAFALLASDPGLTAPAHQALRRAVVRRWKEKLDLGGIS